MDAFDDTFLEYHDDEIKQNLLDAIDVFEHAKSDRSLFLEFDLPLHVAPTALVGRQIHHYWPDDDTWYLGTVASYDPSTAKHHIRYDDGTSDDIFVAIERLRVLVSLNEQLPQPTPKELEAYRKALLASYTDKDLEKADLTDEDVKQRAAQLNVTSSGLVSSSAPANTNTNNTKQQHQSKKSKTATTTTNDNNNDTNNDDTTNTTNNKQYSSIAYGDVVWGKVNGFPDWPALVVTRQHILGGALNDHHKHMEHIPICYFGTYEHQLLKRESVTAALDGAKMDFHTKKTKKRKEFALSIQEMIDYLKNGQLPPSMFTTNDDDDDDGTDDDDDDKNDDYYTKKRSSSSSTARTYNLSKHPPTKLSFSDSFFLPSDLPVQVGNSLYIHSLGKIEWIHPSYHDEKSIYPIGYVSERMIATPASGSKKPVSHIFEICRGNYSNSGSSGGGSNDGSGVVGFSMNEDKRKKKIKGDNTNTNTTTTTNNTNSNSSIIGPPIFKITPKGKPSVQASTPAHAWALLFDNTTTTNTTTNTTTASSINYALQMFGLSIPSVSRSIQSLPKATYLDKFTRWDKEQLSLPPAPQLTQEQQRLKAAAEASLCQLPPRIKPLPALRTSQGVCCICLEEEDDDEDMIIQCDQCKIFVHQACYAVKEAPYGRLWLCDTCSIGMSASPPCCALCPAVGGALKRTTCGRWCHPLCAMWLPETCLDPSQETLGFHGLIQDVDKVHKSRFGLTCQLCKQAYGACIQCCDDTCYSGFHVMCAMTQGLATEVVEDSHHDSDDDDSDDGSDGGDDNTNTNNEATSNATKDGNNTNTTTKKRRKRGRKKKLVFTMRKTKAGAIKKINNNATNDKKTATTINTNTNTNTTVAAVPYRAGLAFNGVRLLAYCKKHSLSHTSVSSERRRRAVIHNNNNGSINISNGIGIGGDDNNGITINTTNTNIGMNDDTIQETKKRKNADMNGTTTINLMNDSTVRRTTRSNNNTNTTTTRASSLPSKKQQRQSSHPFTSARSLPLDSSYRRGLRAPDTVAAANAKRMYIEAVPHVLGGSRLGNRNDLYELSRLQSTARCIPYTSITKQDNNNNNNNKGISSNSISTMSKNTTTATNAMITTITTKPTNHHNNNHNNNMITIPYNNNQYAKSVADRYTDMRLTEHHRIVPGKSAIHGWGAFARQPHSKDDMVIEYVGELIRNSLSDVREKACYDSMVGAGTYVFQLNSSQCVDATRSGNLAHLLNHSCEPNCYSRTISVWNDALNRAEDHVVIFALRDISVWEELTYDYRFSGEERLKCNCGAVRCRGMVNVVVEKREGLVVPRSKVKPYNVD